MSLLSSFFARAGLVKEAAPLPPPYPNPRIRPARSATDKREHSPNVWFHGTVHPFRHEVVNDWDDHAADVKSYHGEDPGGRMTPPHEDTNRTFAEPSEYHWNADLGTHFTSVESTAHEFATNDADHNAPPGYGRVAHCTLHMANPKHYDSESDLAKDAIKWAHSQGHHYGKPGAEDDVNEAVADHYAAVDLDKMQAIDDGEYHHIKSGIQQGIFGPTPGNPGDHYLQFHPKRDEIVHGFREHLKSQGHDGITYGNDYEKPVGHTCAITFGDHQVGIHKWEWTDERSKHLEDPKNWGSKWDEHKPSRKQPALPGLEHVSVLMAHFGAVIPQPQHDPDEDYDTNRQRRQEWRDQVRRGLSRGEVTNDEARESGYSGEGHDQDHMGRLKWEPLPKTLWHVTTNRDAVLADGVIKSRRELGQAHGGSGLGGGPDDTVSFTDNPTTAHEIHRALHEYHRVLNDPDAISKMDAEARAGGYHRQVRAVELGSMNDPEAQDAFHEKALDRVSRGKKPQTEFNLDDPGNPREIDETEDEQMTRRSSWYKTHSQMREWNGGPMNPGFMMNSPHAMAKADPSQFAILRAKPRSGAHGYQVSALGEWRTADGTTVPVDGVEEPLHKTAAAEPYLHATDVLFEPGDLIHPASQVPGGVHSRWGHIGEYSPDHVYMYRASEVHPDFRQQGGALYEVEPTHEHVEADPEPFKGKPGTPGSYRTPGPVRVKRMVSNTWQDPMEQIPEGMRGEGWAPSQQPRAKTAAYDARDFAQTVMSAYGKARGHFPNPYHDHDEWFHGTGGDFDKPDPDVIRSNVDERRSPGAGGPQMNKLLGTHWSALHDTAHRFAPSYKDSQVFHARLKMQNPVHFEDEDGVLHHLWKWHGAHGPKDAQHDDFMDFAYPGATTESINSRMGHLEQVERSGEHSPERRHSIRSGIASAIETHLRFHPQQTQIAKGYVQHLKDQGIDGITYGNVVEGPKYHVCAITFDKDQADVTHVDKIKHDPIEGGGWASQHAHIGRIHGEPEDFLDEVERYHNDGNVRRLPSGSRIRRTRKPGNTGLGEYKYSSKTAGAQGDLPEDLTFSVHYRHPEHPRIRMNDGEAWAFAHADGKNVGGLRWNYHSEPSEVMDVSVHKDYRRRGIGTAMFNWVKENHQSDLEHSTNLTDDGRAFKQSFDKQAGFNGDLPEGFTLDEPRYNSMLGAHDRKVLARVGDRLVGSMQWNPDGEISDVRVHPEYRRRGIADAMWNHAHSREEYGVKPRHSKNRSDSGEAWARSHGDVEPRIQGEGADESYANHHWAAAYQRQHDWLPDHGIFSPTKATLDPVLFDKQERLRPVVKKTVLRRMHLALRTTYPDWRQWTRTYFAGGEASYWWGNHDLDLLVGIDYDTFRKAHPEDADLSDEEISAKVTRLFRAGYNDEEWVAPWDGMVWHVTAYSNPDSWDIRDIKPYSAYLLDTDEWIVRPPKVSKRWGAHRWDEGVWDEAEAYRDAIYGIEQIKDPAERARRGAALYEFLHSSRRNAFGASGKGWKDGFNAVWKYIEYHPNDLIGKLVGWARENRKQEAAA